MEANIQSKSNKNEPLVYRCDKCEKEFKRRSSLTRHIHSNHETIDITLCKLKLKNENLLRVHFSDQKMMSSAYMLHFLMQKRIRSQ